MKEFDVIVIGAGPAGLALSYSLGQQGLSAVILERASEVGSSWGAMPDRLSLVSLWRSNNLLPEDRSYFSPFSQVPAQEFQRYLKGFFQKHRLDVRFGSHVTALDGEEGSFRVSTTQGEFRSRYVAVCTGYYSFPWVPPQFTKVTSLPVMHVRDYRNKDQFKDKKRILIVGKRLSAGQLIEELAPEHELLISARSPVEFSSAPWLYRFFLHVLDEIEALVKWLKPAHKAELEVKMEAKVKPLFERHGIRVVPEVQEVVGKTLRFKDNSIAEVDAIICATGFIPRFDFLKESVGLDQLRDGFEAKHRPGLFFLGFSSQRSFVSRFLRGIREDAPKLAAMISSRAGDKDPHRKAGPRE